MTSTPELVKKQTVLIVDDTPDNISLLSALLKEQYKIKVATNGVKALQIAMIEPRPELILLDVMMPEMDGYETCRRLKSNPATADIPVIFLTARSESQDEELGLRLGAIDYICKPISPPIVMARVATHLSLSRARQLLADQNRHLEHLVAERTAQLLRIQDALILTMASLVEIRGNAVSNHLIRTQHYVTALARQLQTHPRFAAVLTDANIELLRKCAPLHDIGKVGVLDTLLLKAGKLEPHEYDLVKMHTIYGRDTIATMENKLDASDDFLMLAREIAYSHHERWDGTGYPQGLKGEEIPALARLMAVADVYDALISERAYKLAFSHEKAVAIMREGRGSHFDPDILDAFLQIEDQMLAISAQFIDHGKRELQ